MATFLDLKKAEKQSLANPVDGTPLKLAILGDCATQHIATALRGTAYLENFPLQVLDTNFNQIEAQVLDAGSELYAFSPNAVMFVMCTEKLYERFLKTPLEGRMNFAENEIEKICSYWSFINSNSALTSILFCNFPEYDDKVFGNYATKVPSSFLFQIRKLNYLICEKAQQNKSVYLVDVSSIQNEIGRERFFDLKNYYIGILPFSLEAIPEFSQNVISVIKALKGKVKKCVITDLDNTLWGGVIGDDGLSGIQIGELGTGSAYSSLQRYLLELKNRGVILAVCSKNNEDVAKEPFGKHPEMLLHLSDFSMFVTNWEDKASNVKFIQQTLNIGMDSIVFLDDNPFERNLVREQCTGITVPELPVDPTDYLPYLQSLNLFETTSFSEEDSKRTEQYQTEAKRKTTEANFTDYNEYLKSLGMRAEVKAFDLFHYPRIAQLTQRSNQFNLRTGRYTEQQIAQIAESENHITRYFTLKDKFGDMGLVSVVILEKPTKENSFDNDTLFIREWLMSCRVLKRGMEEFIVDKIVSLADDDGYKKVIGEYIASPKNAMVKDIYLKMGFTDIGGGRFSANVQDYKGHNVYIKEE